MFNMSYIYPMTREEKNAKQRLTRLANGNLYTKRYEKTKRGFLMRAYRNMESRVKGIQWRKAHLYEGKELMSRDEFYQFATNDVSFNYLFQIWEGSNYERRFTPSVDRIDSTKGYTLSNIEFVPFHVNCSRGARSKKIINGKVK